MHAPQISHLILGSFTHAIQSTRLDLMFVMHWQLPSAPLIGRVLVAQLLGLLATIAAATGVARATAASPAYPATAALVFAGISCIALGQLRGHPFDAFGAANHVTTLRAVLVSLVAALIGELRSDTVAWTAAVATLIAAPLDAVDGWLARRTSMASAFGARYDMEIDALLILVLSILAWQHGKAGAWIVLAGAMRYLFVAASYVWQWLDRPLPPSVRRKAICVVQIGGLCAIVSPLLTVRWSVTLAAMTLLLLTWSFGVDVLWLRRHGA